MPPAAIDARSTMEFPTKFGKYTLLKHLATGGMADIFLARQRGMGGFEKDVVVKRLLPTHAENQELVSMFLDEARIAANLTHPNIAQIYDLGQHEDDYFIAMEYVRGVDLRRVCSQGIAEDSFLPLQHAVRVVVEVCDALAYAHEKSDADGAPMGIVHRDVTPTNVLITFEGGVKLVDFGIAKAENKASVTKAGQIKGKFGYMSPEQALGGDVDARTDLFAVGINLYEVTVGRRLFRGNDVETLQAIERCDFPTPREVNEDYPEALERIVLKALAKAPEDRYENARDLQMALEGFAASSGLRSTAGMLSDYMRTLFRDQLDLEATQGVKLRELAEEDAAAPDSEPPRPEPEPDPEPEPEPKVPEAPPPQAVAAPEPPTESRAEWNALNVVPQTPAPEHESEANRPPPEPAVQLTDEDLIIKKPRSYAGLLMLLLISVGVWALYTVMQRDLQSGRKRGHDLVGFNAPTLQQQGKAPAVVVKPKKKSLLRLTSEPPGARVVVNGNVLGGLTPTAVQVSEGHYATVRMMLAGYLPKEHRLLAKGSDLDVTLALEEGTAQQTAKLHVESAPPGALVEVNGNLRGETPLKLESVPAGVELSIRLSKEGFYPHTVVYSLTPGLDAALPVKLVPESGPRSLARVKVSSVPTFAAVTRLKQGEKPEPLGRVTNVPIGLNVRVGDHVHVRAEKGGFEPAETMIDVRDPYYTVYLRLPEPQKFHGKLSLLGTRGVTVYVGSEEIGQTPVRNHELTTGEHEVVLVHDKTRKRRTLKVVVKRNETVEKSVVVDEGGITIR